LTTRTGWSNPGSRARRLSREPCRRPNPAGGAAPVSSIAGLISLSGPIPHLTPGGDYSLSISLLSDPRAVGGLCATLRTPSRDLRKRNGVFPRNAARPGPTTSGGRLRGRQPARADALRPTFTDTNRVGPLAVRCAQHRPTSEGPWAREFDRPDEFLKNNGRLTVGSRSPAASLRPGPASPLPPMGLDPRLASSCKDCSAAVPQLDRRWGGGDWSVPFYPCPPAPTMAR